jgi:hypothetical protein
MNRHPSINALAGGLLVPSEDPDVDDDPFRPFTADEYAAQLDGLRSFAQHPDVRCIWEFRPGEGSLPGLSFEPGATQVGASGYWIVTPFPDRRLLVHAPEALRAGRFRLNVSHTVLFDSNLYNAIVRFVEDPQRLDDAQRAGVAALLDSVIARRYGFQLLPYVVESLAINSFAEGFDNAHRALKALLSLHTMDRERFRSDRAVVSDPARLALYEEEFGTSDFDELARLQLEPYRGYETTPPVVTVNLIAFIEMVLIRKSTLATKSLEAQWEAFDSFLFGNFRAHLATLRFTALHYFAGALDRWIKVQRASAPQKAYDALENSAWDLFLGGLPQRLLAESPSDHATISHFCTRERELALYLGTSETTMIKVFSDGRYDPWVGFDFDSLARLLGQERLARVLAQGESRAEAFFDARTGRSKTEHDTLLAILAGQKSRFFEAIGNETAR